MRKNRKSVAAREKNDDEKPRKRTYHDLSDGESESENPNVLYRALRPSEPDPFESGLLPPEGADTEMSASQHITSGSRAKVKSDWISLSRSKKVAAAWSVKQGGSGRVVKVQRPEGVEAYDLTQRSQAVHVFPALQGSSYNTALASQEVVVKGAIGKDQVLDVYDTRRVSVGEYNRVAVNDSVSKIRSRTLTKSRPTPVILTKKQ